MAAKIKTKLDLDKRFKRLSSQALKHVCRTYEAAILDSILDGKSPVRGKGKYKKYSSSYLKAIRGEVSFKFIEKLGAIAPLPQKDRIFTAFGKKVSPVNLKLTSTLLESLRCKLVGQKVIISFTDKLAVVHNFGTRNAGKFRNVTIPARPMLPVNQGERFNLKITKSVQKTLDRVVKKFTAP